MAAVTETEPETVRPAGARPRARWRVILVVLVAGALVASSGSVLVVRSNQRLAAVEALGSAAARAAGATSSLGGPVSAARAALESSEGRVDDERVRADLSDALDEALAATHAEATTQAALDNRTTRLVAARDTLGRATSAVGEAVAQWELAQAQAAWSQAADRLDTAIAAARGVLDTSDGRVADDAVRQALATAITSAQTLRDAAEPAGTVELTSAATALAGAADLLVAPQAAVSAAVELWEQAKAQATAAANEAARAQATQKKPTPTAGTAGKPPVTSGDGHWEETVTYEDLQICMDTEGNSWEC